MNNFVFKVSGAYCPEKCLIRICPRTGNIDTKVGSYCCVHECKHSKGYTPEYPGSKRAIAINCPMILRRNLITDEIIFKKLQHHEL